MWWLTASGDLSVPGSAGNNVCPVTAVLDSGAGTTIMSEKVAAQLQAAVPDVQVVTSMARAHPVKLADGNVRSMQSKTCLVRTALHTSWGPVVLEPCHYAVMPGADDVDFIGSGTLEAMGIDVYSGLEACARSRHSLVSGVDTPEFRACRRVSLAVEALQDAGASEAPVDPSVERLVSRGPEMHMTPEEELVERRVALDRAVQAAADNGMSETGVSKLREVVGRHENAFRRALRGDPPARVEPLRVRFKPGARAVKASPRVYSPVKTAWLAGCMAALVALGLVYRSLQAVWASAAMATPKKGGYRLVSDYRAVNKQIEKVPSVMPNHEAAVSYTHLTLPTIYSV